MQPHARNLRVFQPFRARVHLVSRDTCSAAVAVAAAAAAAEGVSERARLQMS